MGARSSNRPGQHLSGYELEPCPVAECQRDRRPGYSVQDCVEKQSTGSGGRAGLPGAYAAGDELGDVADGDWALASVAAAAEVHDAALVVGDDRAGAGRGG